MKKEVDSDFLEPSPAVNLATIAENGNFVDNLLLQYFVKLTEKDIIIILVHPKTSNIRDFPDFTWTKGKLRILITVILTEYII